MDNTSANNGRFEKYHKMMQKVKQNDKTMSSKNSKIIQPGKKVIKTNQQQLNLRLSMPKRNKKKPKFKKLLKFNPKYWKSFQ